MSFTYPIRCYIQFFSKYQYISLNHFCILKLIYISNISLFFNENKILIISILTILSFPYLQAESDTSNHKNLDLQIAEFTKAFIRKSIEAWVAADIIKEYNKIIERCDNNDIFLMTLKTSS